MTDFTNSGIKLFLHLTEEAGVYKIEMDEAKHEDSVIFMFSIIVKSYTRENYRFWF